LLVMALAGIYFNIWNKQLSFNLFVFLDAYFFQTNQVFFFRSLEF
jgi:hypothetical protein